jgi:FkbM family methyltransferase
VHTYDNELFFKSKEYSNLKKREIDYEFIQAMPLKIQKKLFLYLFNSPSELRQDLFVLSELGFKEKGYFVEFGGTDGINDNNTYFLEKEFGWNGILAEPARVWHKEILKNRNCFIEKKCIWKNSDEKLLFNEVSNASISTIDYYSNFDINSKQRNSESLSKYLVETISLSDLLKKYNAPTIIDYLSVDTEGSEYDILENFNFHKYQFRVITCEHNYNKNREKIHDLLNQYGYIRKYKSISRYDDWYINTNLINAN